MKIKIYKKSLAKDQSGIASMVIVILIMTLLTLIVLAMTQNSNREARQSLDRQLNSQAFYAAESGIGDAKDYVVQNSTTAPDKKQDCSGVSGSSAGEQFPGKSQTIVSSTDPSITNVSYSCVLYNKTPTELKANVSVGSSEVLPIEDANGGIIQSLTFSWTKDGGGSNFAGCQNSSDVTVFLPKLADDCEAGMLRVELLDAAATSRQEFLDKTFLAFFKPSNNETNQNMIFSTAYGSTTNQGAIKNAVCTSSGCRVTINAMSASKLYLHLRSIYRSNKITISATTTSGAAAEFKNAQMEIDSTGKAGDILKRLRVNVPLSNSSESLPEFSLQTTQGICKQLQVRPTVVIDGC